MNKLVALKDEAIRAGLFRTARMIDIATQEVEEVVRAVDDAGTLSACVNLRGHGCLIMSNDLEFIEGVELESRPFPEHQ